MLCHCCEQSQATHLVVSELDGSDVPYCDECDGDVRTVDLTISLSPETYAKLIKLANELEIGPEHLVEATMVHALE